MRTSEDYTTIVNAVGNEKSRNSPLPQMAECNVGLALNMQYVESNHPTKKMNTTPYHHPIFQPSTNSSDANDNSRIFDISTTTSDNMVFGNSFKYSTGGGKMAFTDSQWQEFEKQKMIYKHIISSDHVPPQVLVPLSSLSNRSESEPWRCKRTDGKKWRCSRDVIPDQKYCERHLHKNRPRSRKPVETHTNTKNLSSNNNHQPTHSHLPNIPTSCQQSRCTEWFMKSGTIPLSSSNEKIQTPIHSPSVGSKRDHFFQNLEGYQYHQDFIEKDNCSLTLMQPDGNDTCDDQDFFQMGIGMLNGEGSNSHDQGVHQDSWLGGPLGEALCLGVASTQRPT